jgi:hypothetical protein
MDAPIILLQGRLAPTLLDESKTQDMAKENRNSSGKLSRVGICPSEFSSIQIRRRPMAYLLLP